MNSVTVWLVLTITLSLLLMMISIMSTKEDESFNSNSSFECGMDKMHSNVVSLCMHFFSISILFLVFDMEFVITIPVINPSISTYWWSLFWFFFMMVLLIGLIIEILIGSLDWKE